MKCEYCEKEATHVKESWFKNTPELKICSNHAKYFKKIFGYILKIIPIE